MLQRESNRTAFAAWFLLGAVCISVLQWSHAQATGGIGGLIKAGTDHPLAEIIQSEVPGIPVAPGLGHDGQIYYAIGLDLTGRHVPARMEPTESPAYRYRRIAYPALSSVFGLLDGKALIWGMVVVNAVSVGLATAATAAIARHFRRTPWAALAVVLNPGVWFSALLLTVDNLALAAGLLAILAFLENRLRWAVVALAVAVLTKEVALAFGIGLVGFAGWDQRDRKAAGWLMLGSLAPMAIWLLFIQSRIGAVFDSAGNVGLPLLGLLESAGSWPGESVRDNVLNAMTLIFLAAGTVLAIRKHQLWRWLIWPWIALALLSSRFVWTLGNNSIRVFVPLVVLTVLALVVERTPTTKRTLGAAPDQTAPEIEAPGLQAQAAEPK